LLVYWCPQSRPTTDDADRRLSSRFLEATMHILIQHYAFDPHVSTVVNRSILERLVPLLRTAPGFVAYYWLASGAGSGTSLSVFEDQAAADAALELVAGVVPEQLVALAGKPGVIQGDVKVYANCGL
jgi:hypothetical protein